MTRTVYYVVSASSEENQKGIFHFSRALNDLYAALGVYEETKNDFVGIEKHKEIFRGNEWCVNWDDFPKDAVEAIEVS